MARTVDIGDGTSDAAAAPEVVPVFVPADGVGVTLTNNTGDPLLVWGGLNASAPQYTLTAGNSQQIVAGPCWITSQGVSNVTFTGSGY